MCIYIYIYKGARVLTLPLVAELVRRTEQRVRELLGSDSDLGDSDDGGGAGGTTSSTDSGDAAEVGGLVRQVSAGFVRQASFSLGLGGAGGGRKRPI